MRRGFCGRCGTPLFYDVPGADFINITLGSLDEPQRVKPEAQSNLAGKMHWFAELEGLPVEPEPATDDAPAPAVGSLQSSGGNFQVSLATRHRYAFGKWDVGARTEYGNFFPFYNFFGLGNVFVD